MQIQIDSREHAKQIARIVSDFDRFGVKHFISKLLHRGLYEHG